MKKFLSILTAVGLAASTSTSVISCNNSPEEKVVFPTWIGKVFSHRGIEADKGNTAESVLNQLFELNKTSIEEAEIAKTDVAIRNFQSADWETNGKADLIVVNQSKLIGELQLSIFELSKIDIELEISKIVIPLGAEGRVKVLNYQDLVQPKLEIGDASGFGKLIEKASFDEETGEIVIKIVEKHEILGSTDYITIKSKNGRETRLKVDIKFS